MLWSFLTGTYLTSSQCSPRTDHTVSQEDISVFHVFFNISHQSPTSNTSSCSSSPLLLVHPAEVLQWWEGRKKKIRPPSCYSPVQIFSNRATQLNHVSLVTYSALDLSLQKLCLPHCFLFIFMEAITTKNHSTPLNFILYLSDHFTSNLPKHFEFHPQTWL